MEEYGDWLTKAEACAKLAMSVRALERAVEQGKIRKVWRTVPGLRPIIVHNPEDIAVIAQAQEREKAKTPLVLKGEPRQKRDQALVRRDTAVLVAHDRKMSAVSVAHNGHSTVALEKKLYLTIPEAVAFSGLSEKRLRRLARAKQIPCIQENGYKIWRVALEALSPDVLEA